jgi:hypothetical protein
LRNDHQDGNKNAKDLFEEIPVNGKGEVRVGT